MQDDLNPWISRIQHELLYSISNIKINSYPFPHAISSNVFESESYEFIQDRLPATDLYDFGDPQLKQENKEMNRGFVRFDVDGGKNLPSDLKTFWNNFLSEDFSHSLIEAFCKIYDPWIDHRSFFDKLLQNPVKFRGAPIGRWLLTRDLSGYAVDPHPDTPRKILTALF